MSEKEVLERAFRALDELVGRQVAELPRGDQHESNASRRCTSDAPVGRTEIQVTHEMVPEPAAEAASGAVRAKAGITNQVEIALRWYCSTCGTGGVIWHLPEKTCDAHERAITRAHSERQPGCRRLDYRVMSDSETRPRREA